MKQFVLLRQRLYFQLYKIFDLVDQFLMEFRYEKRLKHLNLPVFNTVKEAVNQTGASASILFVPPAFAADSAMEAADAGIKTCVAIVDGIPSHDMIKIKRYMRRYSRIEKMTLIGPNCAGVISPGKAMLGIMPGHIYKEGRVGIIGDLEHLDMKLHIQVFQISQ